MVATKLHDCCELLLGLLSDFYRSNPTLVLSDVFVYRFCWSVDRSLVGDGEVGYGLSRGWTGQLASGKRTNIEGSDA